MNDEALVLPISGDPAQMAALVAGVQQIVATLTQLGQKTEDTAKKAETAGEKWARFAQVFVNTVSTLRTAGGAISGAADQIARLSAEQQQLDTASARLALDFNEAADGAGRFVDETEAMAAASRLAEAGIRLTQEQLNQLTARAAITSQRLGVDVTQAFDQLTTAIVSGSERALRPFGQDMAALGGESHTAEQRLAAFVSTTRTMPPAVDDATTSMQRLRDTVDDAERTMAASFTAELARLHQISEATRGITTDVEQQTRELRAVGQAAAYTASIVGNTVALVVAGVANTILTVVGLARVAFAELNAMAHGQSPAAAHAAAMAANIGPGSAANTTMGFMQDRMHALAALAGGEGPLATPGAVRGLDPMGRGGHPGTAPTPPTDPNDNIVFTTADTQAANRAADRAVHPTRRGGGGRTAPHRNVDPDALRSLLDRAFGADQEREGFDALMQRAGGGVIVGGGAGSTSMLGGALGARVDEAPLDPMQQRGAAAAAQREQQQLTQRYEAQRTFTERWEELHSRQTSASQHAAEGISAAFESLGQAIGKHAEAFIAGRESVGQALQGILSDTLSSIGKQAVAKGGMELAEGLAALAGVVTAPLAPGHFAAAAAFFAVGAAAGLAGAATAPSAPSAAGPGAAAAPSTSLPSSGSASGGNRTTIFNTFYAPVIGQREGTEAEVGVRLGRYDEAAGARLRRAA